MKNQELKKRKKRNKIFATKEKNIFDEVVYDDFKFCRFIYEGRIPHLKQTEQKLIGFLLSCPPKYHFTTNELAWVLDIAQPQASKTLYDLRALTGNLFVTKVGKMWVNEIVKGK